MDKETKRIYAPEWLGPIAKKYYVKVCAAHRHLKDIESIAMLADAYETWRTARDEVDEYTRAENTFLLGGKEHPSIKVAQNAHVQYERISKRLQLWQDTPAKQDADLEIDLTDDLEADEDTAN